MDKVGIHQRKSTRQTKTKKKPIKVVYISNPMRVKVSASEFRALVQELTGQDSDVTKFFEMESIQMVPDHGMKITTDGHAPEVPGQNQCSQSLENCDSMFFGPFDDVFNSQMMEMENFEVMQPGLSYESSQVNVMRSLDEL